MTGGATGTTDRARKAWSGSRDVQRWRTRAERSLSRDERGSGSVRRREVGAATMRACACSRSTGPGTPAGLGTASAWPRRSRGACSACVAGSTATGSVICCSGCARDQDPPSSGWTSRSAWPAGSSASTGARPSRRRGTWPPPTASAGCGSARRRSGGGRGRASRPTTRHARSSAGPSRTRGREACVRSRRSRSAARGRWEPGRCGGWRCSGPGGARGSGCGRWTRRPGRRGCWSSRSTRAR